MRITTVSFVVTLALGLFVAPLFAEAQQAEKMYRIGFLYPGSEASGASSGLIEAFRQ